MLLTRRRFGLQSAASGVLVLLILSTPAAAQFDEQAAARGISYMAVDPDGAYGGGVAFVDLNNDTFADLVAVADVDGIVGVWENDGTGNFMDRAATSGIPELEGASGVCCGDYNNDGLLDIYITRFYKPNALLRNDGDFTFTNVAADVGVDISSGGQGCGWCDYNRDGRLDLAVSNYAKTNALFRNVSDTQFINVINGSGANTGTDNSLGLAFFDFNLDSLIDLLVLHDAQGGGCTLGSNHMLMNTGSGFVDVAEETNSGLCVDSMSATVGDIDRNGWPDVFITSTYAGHALICNDGGIYTRCDEAAGVTVAGTWGWGSALFDSNNDGWEDLYVSLAGTRNRFFAGGPVWPLSDSAQAMGIDDDGVSFTVATADIDHDGDVDLLLSNWGEPLQLFVNEFSGPATWAKFDVRAEGPRRQAIGARLDARVGSEWQQRHVIAGSNFKSQDDLVQHMGFGSATIIDELFVTWPGGNTRTLTNLAVNSFWVIHPTEDLGDANADDRVNFNDFLVFAGCHGLHVPGSHVPGCEIMDFDGDCDVDLHDLGQFWIAYGDPLEDCNGNGVPDLEEILAGDASDADADWAIDDCGTLPGDVDGNGSVGLSDLLLVIGNWGCGGCSCSGDADADCLVGLSDLLLVIGNWGASV